jgi:hypothetical protein
MMTVGGSWRTAAGAAAAEDRDELFVDDLHDLLRGVERPVDLVAERARAPSP